MVKAAATAVAVPSAAPVAKKALPAAARRKKAKAAVIDGIVGGKVPPMTAAPSKQSSKYFGVSWEKPLKKWRAQIRIDKKRRSLGRWANEEDAARHYDYAMAQIPQSKRNPQMKFNFPDDAANPVMPVKPQSISRKAGGSKKSAASAKVTTTATQTSRSSGRGTTSTQTSTSTGPGSKHPVKKMSI